MHASFDECDGEESSAWTEVVVGEQQETVERVGPELNVNVELSLSHRRTNERYEPGRRELGILDHNVCIDR